MDYKQIIGLGTNTNIDSIVVIWPNLSVTKILHPAIDTVHILKQENTVKAEYLFAKTKVIPLMDSVKSIFEKHQEDANIDFYYERNLPKMTSREGPKAAVADVNGDGLEDVFIGGTAGHAGQLYLQDMKGNFIKKEEKSIEMFKDFEDVAVLFFDYDHDGDLDLFIGPGGNNNKPESRQMQLRLFRNDGKGNFEIDPYAFPNTGMNISVAIAEDFNHDGFPDLFVGARSEPRNYGVAPSSYLFLNDGKGHFTDIAKTKNPDIANIGMVTGAAWADIMGDNQKELILVGEWMAPRIFSFSKDHFIEQHSNLSNMLGWWQSLAIADIDGDGRKDLVIGNIGENFCLKPDFDHPVKLWINDFDQNQASDRIITTTIDGKDMPFFMKHEMEDQIPSLKKKSLKHMDYAKKPIQELFSTELINSCKVIQFNYGASIVAFNNGTDSFSIQKLPTEIQFSSANAISCTDLNGDGKVDIVIGGNEYGFLPQFERLDASYGAVILNIGKRHLQLIDKNQSGVEINGQVRDIQEIKTKSGKDILFLRNDMYPLLFKVKAIK